MNPLKNDIFVISGPSGVGKSTLAKKLLEFFPDLKKSISYTTRPKREEENEGVDYHFIDRIRFEDMANSDKFIEWVKIYDSYYGTTSESLNEHLSSKCDILLVIDILGASNIKKIFPQNTVSTYIIPPDINELERRLSRRSRNATENDVEKRLAEAKEEIKKLTRFDYVVMNDDFEECFRKLRSIIVATRCRIDHTSDMVEFLDL